MSAQPWEGFDRLPVFSVPRSPVPLPTTTFAVELDWMGRRFRSALGYCLEFGYCLLLPEAAGRTAAIADVGHVKPSSDGAAIHGQIVGRARLDQSVEGAGELTSYRTVVEPLEWRLPQATQELLAATRSLAEQLSDVSSGFWGNSRPGEFVDAVAARYFTEEQRFKLFRTCDLGARLRFAHDVLEQRIAARQPAPPRRRRIASRSGARRTDSRVGRLIARMAKSGLSAEQLEQSRAHLAQLEPLGEGSEVLEWAEAMPWDQADQAALDPWAVRQELDRIHPVGGESVKVAIVRHIGVLQRLQELGRAPVDAPALLLVGPPGTGKTSFAAAIASALGRPFLKIQLAGVNEATSLRGSSRHYLRGTVGSIVSRLREGGSLAPVFLLDEVDKATQVRWTHGIAADVVLDLLGAETFVDEFLQVPIPVRQVIWILTANELAAVPAPLLDRVELVQVPAYSGGERRRIAQLALLPRLRETLGLTDADVTVPDSTLRLLVDEYAIEAGVRGLN